MVGADSGSGSRGTCDAVRRGDERVCAVVDVQQRALCAFEQEISSASIGFVERARHVRYQRRQARSERESLVHHLVVAQLGLMEVVLQDEIVELEHCLQNYFHQPELSYNQVMDETQIGR